MLVRHTGSECSEGSLRYLSIEEFQNCKRDTFLCVIW